MKLRNKKTGEIIETHLLVVQSVEDPTKRYYTSSIKDLCDNYEDYKPSEPLIKDEKPRKIFREWAEINNVDKVQYCDYASGDCSFIFIYDGDEEVLLDFRFKFDNLISGKTYTTAELCGEEEEC